MVAHLFSGHGIRHRHLQGECAVLLVFILNGAGYAVTVTVFFNVAWFWAALCTQLWMRITARIALSARCGANLPRES